MLPILNNKLSWDGSHLGSYVNVIMYQWSLEEARYCSIAIPMISMVSKSGSKSDIPGGIIYCMAVCTKNVFPCIVEDIKEIFDIPRRGVHRIIIDGKDYIIYYVPVSTRGEVIWETPLNRLNMKHDLRRNPDFRKSVQKIIAFCDILSLTSTGEPSMRIRPGVNGESVLINVNETTTTIPKSGVYDYSIISKTLFGKWFGEETSISDTVKEMLVSMNNNQHRGGIRVPRMSITSDNLSIITSHIRSQVDEVIKRYDNQYIWYSYFIIDRMSRYLLIDI